MENSHGVEIKACCASCRFKDQTRLMTSRFCTQHHQSVKPDDWCGQWAISDQLAAAGSGGGRVKRRAYLRYVLEVRSDESLADQRGLKFVRKNIDQIRQEFEKEQGGIFLSL